MQFAPSQLIIWIFTLILSTHLRLFLSGLHPPKPCMHLPPTIRSSCPDHLNLFDLITSIVYGKEFLIMQFSPVFCYLLPLMLEYLPQHARQCESLSVRDQMPRLYETSKVMTFLYILIFTFLGSKREETKIMKYYLQYFQRCNTQAFEGTM